MYKTRVKSFLARERLSAFPAELSIASERESKPFCGAKLTGFSNFLQWLSPQAQ
jgi:hypothetical protein